MVVLDTHLRSVDKTMRKQLEAEVALYLENKHPLSCLSVVGSKLRDDLDQPTALPTYILHFC